MYKDNTVGSALTGFYFDGGIGKCSEGHGVKAFACGVGVTGNPSTRNLYYTNLNIIDCSTGVKLETSRKGTNINAYVEDSYIVAVDKTNCDFCYGNNAINCKSTKGI